MNENENLVPKRRFKEFTNTGTWEQRKLIDVAEMFDNLRIPVTASDRVEGNTAYYGANGIQDYVDGFTHDGEFVLIAEDGANDLINYPVNYVKGKIWVNNHAHVVSGKKSELDNLFLTARIKSMNISHWLVGGGRAKLNGDVLKKIPLTLPIYEEQKKIGAFFKQLDDAIALHLCKQRQLGLLKQRLIKEILPQSDSTLPHLRFANFRKPWEQHQLKEVLKVNSGRDYKHLNEGNIPVYGTGGYMLSVDGKLSDVDGIGLGRKGTIDKPQYLKAPFWTVDTLFYLTPSPNYDIYFLYTLIQNVNWKSMDESTGVPSLSKSVIERVTLTFPILEEQQKIGSFFREFDNTISLHQQKIAHLKALKSTILNKMFI